MTPRLRFAPSPTGSLHLGGARTALFNWLYARHTGGAFLLRIEDTDLDRSTEESKAVILEGMKWLGMVPDEPYVLQSARREAHLALAHQLLENGRAYKCFSTPEEVEAMRARAVSEGRNPKYDGTWRDRTDHPTDGRPYAIRIKLPHEGSTTIDDIVLGEITVSHTELDDLVIVRSDGTPTYNFVVVCDDAHMRITHVVRGQDHVSNTFRQYHIYQALDLPIPRFAHLPMIDGLSKRKGSASVTAYRDLGILPEALISYLARLGWSHGDQELFRVDELIKLFDLAEVNRGSGTFDETKLTWVNAQWIRQMDPRELAERLIPYLAAIGIHTELDDRLVHVAEALQPRGETLVEIAAGAPFAYVAPTSYEPKAVAKWMKPAARDAYVATIDALATLTPFTVEAIDELVQRTSEAHTIGMGKLAQPIRVGLTGTAVSPSIGQTICAIGRDESVKRLRDAVSLFDETPPGA